jgi:hypothetical protein
MKKLFLLPMMALAAGIQPGRAAEVRTLPPEVYGQMKKAKNVTQLFVSPDFRKADGFRCGQVNPAVQSVYANSLTAYVPVAFARLAKPESPNVLTLALTDLKTRDKMSGSHSVWTTSVGIEGQVLDPAGKLLMAFVTSEESHEGVGNLDSGKLGVDAVVKNLARELDMPLAAVAKAPGWWSSHPAQAQTVAPPAAAAAPAVPAAAVPAVPAAAAAPAADAATASAKAPAPSVEPPQADKPAPAPADDEELDLNMPGNLNAKQHH